MNYNKEMIKILESLDNKPSILLHSCCGPCSTAVIERLIEYLDITVIYYNPNNFMFNYISITFIF